jgi:ATP-dependent DNA helicase Rep
MGCVHAFYGGSASAGTIRRSAPYPTAHSKPAFTPARARYTMPAVPPPSRPSKVSDLNPRQRAAVRYVQGPLLVLAGAGSGKTRVITYKIAHLIREHRVSPRNIAAVTFTNKAAREMKQRVGTLLQGQEGKGLSVSTFHTLGLNILRREHARLGYKPGFSVFDAQDAAALLRELASRAPHASESAAQQLASRISLWKNALLGPEQAVADAADEADEAAARLYALYERHLRAYNAFDFDDLILRPVQLLGAIPEVRAGWEDRIRYLLVDEYQDTNAAQYQLVKLIAGRRGAFSVVGDDDQSVYAWRGARPENLRLLREEFPHLEVIKLEQNYRSTGRILRAANQLIGQNSHLFEKRLWSDLGPGDPLRVLSCRDEQHEAERVVTELLRHRLVHRTHYGDYAILYRGNHQARVFERVLREHRVPYVLSGGTSFFERSEVKDIMAYLRLLVNQDDDAAFLRAVAVPRREVGPATLEKLGAYATQRGKSLFAASFEFGLEQQLSGRPLEKLRRFTHWLVDIGDRAQRGDPVAAVRQVVQDIDYAGWLNETCSALKTAQRRLENVYELIAWLQRLAGEDLRDRSLGEMVAHLTLMDILERAEEDQGGDRVHLMTLHAAKGLEFGHVFLVGMEEDLLPHRESLASGSLEEERRLAYVGITRARRGLTFTFAARRRRYGDEVDCQPSRFLSELPPEDLAWETQASPASGEERLDRGRAHLANLKGFLSGS